MRLAIVSSFLIIAFQVKAWAQFQPLPSLSQDINLSAEAFQIPELKIKVLEADRVGLSNSLLRSLVMIVNQDNHEICTGTVIGARTVLTAAHCLPKDPQQVLVLAGQDPLNSDSSKILPVSDFLKFLSYDDSQKFSPYDLALVFFDEDLSNFGLDSLKVQSEIPSTMVFQVAGYGLGSDRNQKKKRGDPALSDGILRAKLLRVDSGLNRGSSFIIMNQSEGGLCFGDSGSPALLKNLGRWEVYAIAHSVFNPNHTVGEESTEICSSKARYLKLEAFYAWIQQNTI